LRGEIKDVRGEIKDLRGELWGAIQDLRKDMQKQLYWLIGTMIAIAGVVIALFKF